MHEVAAEIQPAVRKCTLNKAIPLSYEIEAQLHDIKQENMTVNKYYTQLTHAQQQLDVFEVHHLTCAANCQLYKTITAKESFQITHKVTSKL